MDGTLTLSMTLRRLLMGMKEPPLPMVSRRAIDASGGLGSLYDAYKDIILGTMNVNSKRKKWQTLNTRRCIILDGNADYMENILKIFGVEHDLRLSLLVNLRERTGIAEIIDDDIEMNEYTRLFYYSYWDQEVNLLDEAPTSENIAKPTRSQTNATHVVTGVRTGIDLLIILQLPTKTRLVAAIDNVLHKTRTHLLDYSDNTFELTPEDEKILENITHTKVYSNMYDLRYITNFYDIYRHIEQYENDSAKTPVAYSLRSVRWLYPGYFGVSITCLSIDEEISNNVEEYIIQLRHDIRQLQSFIYRHLPKLLNGYLRNQLMNLQKTFTRLNKRYFNELEHLGKSVIDVRSARKHVSLLSELLNNSEQKSIRNSIQHLTRIARHFEEKALFITFLSEQQLRYLNVADFGIDHEDNLNDIQRKLIVNEYQDRFLCSNDTLNETRADRLAQLLQKLKSQANLHLTYADFTYSSFELENIIVLPLGNNLNEHNVMLTSLQRSDRLSTRQSQPPIENQKEAQTHALLSTTTSVSSELHRDNSLSTKTQAFIQSMPENLENSMMNTSHLQAPNILSSETSLSLKIPLEDTDTFNVLLLGETGVGKSTFINAFVNYLAYDSLQQAISNKPISLIPVSFLVNLENHAEESLIQFGDMSRFKDEDFEHPGQSVTQQCRSYVFQLNHVDGKQLRLIDTPGFGDSRGIEQDDYHMQHILEYITNLSHLNAICFLLKSDQSRLNISFRSCFTQLFTLLDRNALGNLLFCFTNARLASYTPGETTQSLKRVLESLSISDIPFTQDNAFCFDNESFRYLVARQSRIPFDNVDKRNFERSWSLSIGQLKKFVEYVCQKLPLYYLENNIRSTKHAALKINQLLRPILETMRNLLRNLIQNRKNPIRVSIELTPVVFDHPIIICSSCQSEIIEIGPFYIEIDTDHKIHQQHCPCKCSQDDHQFIEYILDYELSQNASVYDRNEMTKLLNQLCYTSAEFSYFLLNDSYLLDDDRFLAGLVKMIGQEEKICQTQKNASMNSELVKELTQIKQQYSRYIHELELSKKMSRLSVVYKRIRDISEYPMIHEQLDAFQQGQKLIMKENEYEVPNDLHSLVNT